MSFTIVINGAHVAVPNGAVAYKYAEPGTGRGACWVYDHDNARRIESENPDLIVWAQ